MKFKCFSLILILLFATLSVESKQYWSLVNIVDDLKFDSETQYADFLPSYFSGKSFGEDIFIKIEATPSHSIGILTQENSFEYRLNNDRSLDWICWEVDGSENIISTSAVLNEGSWIRLFAIFDELSAEFTIYQDATLLITGIACAIEVGINKFFFSIFF
jgi:hypothetical protein